MKSGANSRRFDSWTLLSGVLALLYSGTLLFTPLHLLLEKHSHGFSFEPVETAHHAEDHHHDERDDHDHEKHPASDHDLALAHPAKFSPLDALHVAIFPLSDDFVLPVVESLSALPMDTGPPEHSPPRSPAQPRSPPLV